MSERKFNPHDIGMVPELFCWHCGTIIAAFYQREDNTIKGFILHHSSHESCPHSNKETAMPVLNLAKLLLAKTG